MKFDSLVRSSRRGFHLSSRYHHIDARNIIKEKSILSSTFYQICRYVACAAIFRAVFSLQNAEPLALSVSQAGRRAGRQVFREPRKGNYSYRHRLTRRVFSHVFQLIRVTQAMHAESKVLMKSRAPTPNHAWRACYCERSRIHGDTIIRTNTFFTKY